MHKAVAKLSEAAEVIPGNIDDKLSQGLYKYLVFQPNSFTDTGEIKKTTYIFREEPVLDKYLVKQHDVIIKRLNPSFVYFVENVKESSLISQNLFTIRVVADNLLPEYLAYLFEQPAILSQITQLSGSSSAIRAVSVKMISEILLPILPLEKQRSIGELWRLSKRRQALIHEYEFENRRLMAALYDNYIK